MTDDNIYIYIFYFLVKLISLVPFLKEISEFDKFVMGHAILTELIGWVDKTLKMISFSRKHLFNDAQNRTLMAALLFGTDF